VPRGPLIIVSGPSGCGKSTLIGRGLKQSGLPLHLAVSATTRTPRPGEEEGVHYFFGWDRTRFQGQADDFLEHAEVYGNHYGTPRAEVERHQQAGTGVILDIDVQGAQQVRQRATVDLSVFIQPPSLEELERRLRGRGTEDEAALTRRLDQARREMEHAGEYDVQLVNEFADSAAEHLRWHIAALFHRPLPTGEGSHAG